MTSSTTETARCAWTSTSARTGTLPQHCYVCKQQYTAVHHFYDQLCPPCAELNFAKRTETADLRGRVALLTGGRVKIGYQAGIKLLRAGARADRHDALPARRRAALRRRSPTSTSGATGSRSSGSTCATRRASRRSAATSTRRATGSTSSSTTRARPCAARPTSTAT